MQNFYLQGFLQSHAGTIRDIMLAQVYPNNLGWVCQDTVPPGGQAGKDEKTGVENI